MNSFIFCILLFFIIFRKSDMSKTSLKIKIGELFHKNLWRYHSDKNGKKKLFIGAFPTDLDHLMI